MMRKLFLPLALILSSFCISCSNESTQVADNSKMYDKSYIESASIKEKLEYKKFHLLKLANWVNKKILLAIKQIVKLLMFECLAKWRAQKDLN